MSDRLLRVHAAIADHLAEIEEMFRPGAKLTLVVRNPGVPGDAGVLCGNDKDLDAVIAEIRRRQADASEVAGG